jgi:hypothetical protein
MSSDDHGLQDAARRLDWTPLFVKLILTVIVTTILIVVALCFLHLPRFGFERTFTGVVSHFLSNITLSGLVASCVPYLIMGALIFDLLSVIFFRLGFDKVDMEFTVQDGEVMRAMTKTQKFLSTPFALLIMMLLIAALTFNQVEQALTAAK